MLMYDPFHRWEGPDLGHLLQASSCRIFGGAWPCPTRSEHLSCISLNNGWKEIKWLGYSWVEPVYDRRETAFTQQPSNPRTCVRSEGWNAGLSSAWRDLNPQSPLPKRCPHADRSTSSGSGEGEKYPDGVALCSGYSPWEGGGCVLPQGVHLPLAGSRLDPFWRFFFHDMANPVLCQKWHSHMPERRNSISTH